MMDATRLGITFQEAQAVLRNIRNRQRGTREPRLPRPSENEHDIKRGRTSECSSSESPYFTVPNIFLKSESCNSNYQNWKKSTQSMCPEADLETQSKLSSRNGNTYKRSTYDSTLTGGSSYLNSVSAGLPAQQESTHPTYCPSSFVSCEKQEERKVNLQTTLPKTSSIGKRLEEFKHCHVPQEQQLYHSRITPLARKSTNSNAAKLLESQPPKMITPLENSACKQNDFHQQKVPTEAVSKPIHAAKQMDITLYLPKVKQHRTKAKAQTNIQDFSSAKSEKIAAENIESMSLEEREVVTKKILAASTVACTLLYVDGSTLLRPSTIKSVVKAIYLSFSGNVTDDCCRILFPLTSLKENSSEYYQWFREFFSNFMVNESNKVIYNAQKFVKTMINVLNIEYHTDCFHWRCFDPKIASWLFDPDHPPEDYDALLRNGFGNEKLRSNESDKNNELNSQLDEDMFSLLSLMPDMFLALQEKKLWELFSEVEMKVSPILAVMELVGVEIDTKLLLDYGNILKKKIKKLEDEGYKSVGRPFQMSSTQQLRQILFKELQLDKNVQKRLARTQIKNYKSTSENVLRHLQDFHPLPKIILEYRSVTKVNSAFVDGVLHFVKNDVLHTNWYVLMLKREINKKHGVNILEHLILKPILNQTCTATGRLTSTNPNIQAIPKNQLDITGVAKQYIIGKEMEVTSIVPRKAFKSRTGWSFLSSDFQSIELRLLAHFSEDPLLLRIFNESEDDIFVQLASIWLSVDPKSVQSEDRERAKRVVYSVVYGVGKERLAETLNVSADQAKSFTTSFLATFIGLKHFIQSCINECRKQGYVTTIFGRRRLLPGINSTDPHLRSQSERQAVNFVIQGSAADICKMGMILVVQSLQNKDLKLKARLLIQIHDELVLEVHDDYIENVKELVKVCLEDTDALCGGHVKLKVNLKVSVSCGKTWAEMQPFCSDGLCYQG